MLDGACAPSLPQDPALSCPEALSLCTHTCLFPTSGLGARLLPQSGYGRSDLQGMYESLTVCAHVYPDTVYGPVPVLTLPGPGLGSATWLAASWPQVQATPMSR